MPKKTARIALATVLSLVLVPAVAAAPPGATTGDASDVTSTSATLNGTANPNKEETTFYFEYGPTPAYGSRTPDQPAGGGNAGKAVSAAIGGLSPSTTYHFRLVVRNASGSDIGQDKTFTTLAAGGTGPQTSSVTIGATPAVVTFGRPATIAGQVSGNGAAGAQVELESTPFPFSAPFKRLMGPAAASPTGAYSFVVTPQQTSRYRVNAKTQPPSTSPLVEVRVRLAVGLSVSDSTARRGQRVRFFGAVKPAHDGRTVSIQRRTSTGSYRTIARTTLQKSTTAGQSTFSRRIRVYRTGVYRVRVGGDGDHVTGTSRTRRVRRV